MGKQAAVRKLNDAQASARIQRLRVSPQKLNEVAEIIRGLSAEQAVIQLTFCKRRIANDVKVVLSSAIANAENNHNLDIDSLVVDRVNVGKSIVMKRFRARARGRGARIVKPFSNLEIILREIQAE
jgi:large subunit ribosomal protein L22